MREQPSRWWCGPAEIWWHRGPGCHVPALFPAARARAAGGLLLCGCSSLAVASLSVQGARANYIYRVHGCVLCVCAVLIVFFFNDADRVIVTIGGVVV